ncbi:pyridoxal phosphate-dependent transferase [Aspergillus heterothallicus]
MVHIKKFEVEDWMDTHETWAKHNLAETCCASLSLQDLLDLSKPTSSSPSTTTTSTSTSTSPACERTLINFTAPQTYGAIRGSPTLRSRIADLYNSSALSEENILVTNGAIQANFLALYTLIKPGDHVIVQYPTYQQLYSVPESLGAEVSLWKWKRSAGQADGGAGFDLDELRALVKNNTRMIVLNNPQNPTGAVLPKSILEEIVTLARRHNILIHCDEVYRPLFHSLPPDAGPSPPPSILEMGYDNVLATGSLSKAFSLAGVRVGWIATPNKEILEDCASSRHYTMISLSQLDDGVAAFTLAKPTVGNLLNRNVELAKKNLALLAEFVGEFEGFVHWVKPQAGTTAFLAFRTRSGEPVDDEEFCNRLQKTKGVMLVPGSKCFGGGEDFRGYVRVGFVPEHNVMVEGLQALREFMVEEYHNVPAAAAH